MHIRSVIKKSYGVFSETNPLRFSSSISFYLMFSLPAILMILLTISGLAFEDQMVRETVLSQVRSFFGDESAGIISDVIQNSQELQGGSMLMKAVSLGMLLFSATAVFSSLQDGLNAIWKLKPKPEKDFLNFLKNRLLSFGLLVSIGFILVVFLVLDAALSLFGEFLKNYFTEGVVTLMAILNVVVSIATITLVFGMMYSILPDARVKLKSVFPGAFLATVLFVSGKYLVGVVLKNSPLDSFYGASGSLVLLLIWVFYSTSIVLYGAAFTKALLTETSDSIRPYKHAVFVEEKETKELDHDDV